MKNEIRDIFASTYMRLCKCLPMDKKKIVFKSFRGIECGDNPRAIFDALFAKRPDLHYVWVVANDAAAASLRNAGAEGKRSCGADKGSSTENGDSDSLKNLTIVRHGSLAEIKELATAKIWVDNKRKGCWTSKRKGQFYLQTWHGGIALKRIEKDAEDKLPAYYIKSAKKDSKMADAFVSGSAWQTKNYRKAFWYDGEMWETGLPRNDIYFLERTENDSASAAEISDAVHSEDVEMFPIGNAGRRVRAAFGLNETDHVIVYAPTFREDYSMDAYNLDCERLLSACGRRFGGEWKLIMRLHPNVADREEYFHYNDRVLNGCRYPLMSELVAGSDILVTDYSSCMFDAAEGGKIVFIYASDVEDYLADRGFYFEFWKLPFAIAETNEQLKKNIEAFSEKEYAVRTGAFLQKLEIFDNSNAAETVANRLLDILDKV